MAIIEEDADIAHLPDFKATATASIRLHTCNLRLTHLQSILRDSRSQTTHLPIAPIMCLLMIINMLLTALAALLFPIRISASRCAAEAYIGGNTDGCHGARLAVGNVTSSDSQLANECFPAANAGCIQIAPEEDGERCYVVMAHQLDCSGSWLSVSCAQAGFIRLNFRSFEIQCQ